MAPTANASQLKMPRPVSDGWFGECGHAALVEADRPHRTCLACRGDRHAQPSQTCLLLCRRILIGAHRRHSGWTQQGRPFACAVESAALSGRSRLFTAGWLRSLKQSQHTFSRNMPSKCGEVTLHAVFQDALISSSFNELLLERQNQHNPTFARS